MNMPGSDLIQVRNVKVCSGTASSLRATFLAGAPSIPHTLNRALACQTAAMLLLSSWSCLSMRRKDRALSFKRAVSWLESACRCGRGYKLHREETSIKRQRPGLAEQASDVEHKYGNFLMPGSGGKGRQHQQPLRSMPAFKEKGPVVGNTRWPAARWGDGRKETIVKSPC